MKIYIALTLLTALTLTGCKAPSPPVNDDTLETSEVDGVKLIHRHAIEAPTSFSPVNQDWRALYSASVMSRPDFSGKVVSHLENGKNFTVLGTVQNGWLAIAEPNQQLMLGYVPQRAGVISDRYEATLRKDRPRPRKAAKQVCVDVGGDSKACRSNSTATWILD